MCAFYKYRKHHFVEYPDGFVRIHVSKNSESRWLVVDEALDDAEVEKYDLVYLGHNMTYDRCLKEIERLAQQEANYGLYRND